MDKWISNQPNFPLTNWSVSVWSAEVHGCILCIFLVIRLRVVSAFEEGFFVQAAFFGWSWGTFESFWRVFLGEIVHWWSGEVVKSVTGDVSVWSLSRSAVNDKCPGHAMADQTRAQEGRLGQDQDRMRITNITVPPGHSTLASRGKSGLEFSRLQPSLATITITLLHILLHHQGNWALTHQSSDSVIFPDGNRGKFLKEKIENSISWTPGKGSGRPFPYFWNKTFFKNIKKSNQ